MINIFFKITLLFILILSKVLSAQVFKGAEIHDLEKSYIENTNNRLKIQFSVINSHELELIDSILIYIELPAFVEPVLNSYNEDNSTIFPPKNFFFNEKDRILVFKLYSIDPISYKIIYLPMYFIASLNVLKFLIW